MLKRLFALTLLLSSLSPAWGATYDSTGAQKTNNNVTQLNGTTVDTNSGNKSAGTQRVVLATDQVQLTNALKVDGSAVTQPVSLSSLPALVAGTAYAGKVRLTDGTNDITLSTTPADGASNTVNTLPVLAYLLGFNGTTWDRLQLDGSKFLKVTIAAALPAGSNVIGHVIADSGSTTAVTGNVAVTKADGSDVTLGAKADAKSTATDTTAITAMSVLKEISAMEQAPASRAVTNAGTFAVQAAESDGANVTLGAKGDAKSTATDTTAVSAISVLKQISASVQAPPSQAVTNAGTFAVQAAESGTWTVTASGDVASGSSDSGNPVKQGYLAKTALPTAVSDAQRVNGIADKYGRQVVIPEAMRDLEVHQQTTITASTTETTILAAGGASVFTDVTHIDITNSSATATLVTIKDSNAGTTQAIYSIGANSGISISFPVPLVQSGANATWTATCGTSVSSIYVNISAVKNK